MGKPFAFNYAVDDSAEPQKNQPGYSFALRPFDVFFTDKLEQNAAEIPYRNDAGCYYAGFQGYQQGFSIQEKIREPEKRN